jgi:hypothetical protein
MNTEALLRLADKLEGKGPYEKIGPIRPDRFNMGNWVDSNYLIRHFMKLVRGGVYVVGDDLPCGTAACACGWAGSDSWFQERGFFTLVRNGIAYFEGDNNSPYVEFTAARKFFDISETDAKYLFMPNDFRTTPSEVAKHIRGFVDRRRFC